MQATRQVVRTAMRIFALVVVLGLAACGPSIGDLQEAGNVPALVEIAEEPGADFTDVSNAVDAIGEIASPEAVEVLIAWTEGDDDSLRTAAIPALGATGDPAAAEPLIAQLAALDPDDTMTYELDLRALVIALGGIDDPRAAGALLGRVDAGDSPLIGESYLGAALAGQGEDIVAAVRKRMISKDPDVYTPCGVALYELNADDAARVRELLAERATQRVWAGVFSAGMESGFEAELIDALRRFDDLPLARKLVNADDPEMEQAARDWAGEHGYTIEQVMQFGTTP